MTAKELVPSVKPFLRGTLAPVAEPCLFFIFSERKLIDCTPVDFLVTDSGHPHPFFNSSSLGSNLTLKVIYLSVKLID